VQFEETDDDEPAQPDDVLATQREIVAEVERCRRDPGIERRLMKAASLILKTTTVLKGRCLPDDLLQDALVALVTGRRSWKKNRVDFIWLVMGVMKSLASSRDNSLGTKDAHVVLEGELRAKDDEDDGDSVVGTFGDADASPEALLLQAEQKAEEDSVFVVLRAKFAGEDLAGLILDMIAERKGYTLAEIREALGVGDREFWNANRRLTRAFDELGQTGMKP
jgi:hypothetical protein